MYNWERDYSRLFKLCLSNNINCVVNFLVLSEVFNRTIRLEYNKYLGAVNKKSHKLPFKSFRDSNDGQDVQTDIYNQIDKILDRFSVREKVFTNAELRKFLTVDQLDFNDKAVAALCAENKYILATNDKDYSKANIDIISSNPVVLNKR